MRTNWLRRIVLLISPFVIGAGAAHAGHGPCQSCAPYPQQASPYHASDAYYTPGQPAADPLSAPQTPLADSFQPQAQGFQPTFAQAPAGEFAASSVAGFIDSAVIRTRVRMRYDNAWGGDSDRAEFLYGAYDATQAFGGIVGGDADDVQLAGPTDVVIDELDYQQFSTYFEYALAPNVSAFVELPVRSNDITGWDDDVNDRVNIDEEGLGQINAGFRVGLIRCPEKYLTFQYRVITASGDDDFALSNGHTAIMPGFLFQRQVNNRFVVFGEIHDWIAVDGTVIDDPNDGPLDGEEFHGNVLRYGVGAGYDVYQSYCNCDLRALTLVGEVVGWTVLDGLESQVVADGDNLQALNIRDAEGDTIVNAKVGVRYRTGPHNLYAGYGLALTDDDWYDDIFRVEYEYNIW